mmetsp:Transcript_140125/g.364229  ORF Transcript_140125/g.364229 Transcript_140125/m.364229 type:complete len:336 (-) Transcript_140125:985-1992(-)
MRRVPSAYRQCRLSRRVGQGCLPAHSGAAPKIIQPHGRGQEVCPGRTGRGLSSLDRCKACGRCQPGRLDVMRADVKVVADLLQPPRRIPDRHADPARRLAPVHVAWRAARIDALVIEAVVEARHQVIRKLPPLVHHILLRLCLPFRQEPQCLLPLPSCHHRCSLLLHTGHGGIKTILRLCHRRQYHLRHVLVVQLHPIGDEVEGPPRTLAVELEHAAAPVVTRLLVSPRGVGVEGHEDGGRWGIAGIPSYSGRAQFRCELLWAALHHDSVRSAGDGDGARDLPPHSPLPAASLQSVWVPKGPGQGTIPHVELRALIVVTVHIHQGPVAHGHLDPH